MRTIQNHFTSSLARRFVPVARGTWRPAFAAITLSVVVTAPAMADQYRDCVALAAQNPDAAYDFSLQWESTDTTGGALHCGGIALMGLRLFDAAAERFERAASLATKVEDSERAVLYRQAGDAWLATSNSTKALEAFTAGLRYLPKDPALLFGRARAHDLAEAPAAGLEDVNMALGVAPERVDFLVLRARFYRQLGSYDLALADITTALAAGADAIPIQLERGMVRYEQGDLTAARSDWQAVIERDRRPNGEPGAAAAAAARFIAEIEKENATTQP
ncbi:MAG: hypothetical protein JJ939_04345 [Alphaproteobacteria bacterium]|nr:hypothetical protein [Alphaproteobacteria bacterium]MBO6627633.1 hypothetical protein [Alphaproteobacteria bacterium]MDF1627748.1 hypothetical protein [Parvibaculaceae bacterium]